MPGDNLKVEVRSEGRKHFEAAMRLAWSSAPGGKATHYITPVPEGSCIECSGSGKKYALDVEDARETVTYRCKQCRGTGKQAAKSGMILLWHEDHVHMTRASLLPFALTVDAAIDFLWSWLETADFGNEPDHDGSNGKGFIVTTGDFWGHVEGSHYAFLGVYPDWQMYGK